MDDFFRLATWGKENDTMFRKEAVTMSVLDHPHICNLASNFSMINRSVCNVRPSVQLDLPPEVVCLMLLKTVSSSILLWSFVKVAICSITCRLAKNLVYRKALLHAWCGNCFVPSATCMGDCWHMQILRQEMSFYWRTIQIFHSSTWQPSWPKLIWIMEIRRWFVANFMNRLLRKILRFVLSAPFEHSINL